MTEDFRPIDGYPHHEVSNLGTVRNVARGRVLKARASNCGYLRVTLSHGGRHREHTVHRLVASAFLPTEAGRPDVNHKDGDKRNCAAGNLEWCSKSENMKHAAKNGLLPNLLHGSGNGSANPGSKLDEAKAMTIKRRLALGESPTAIARDFGVVEATIRHIKNGHTWSHISPST